MPLSLIRLLFAHGSTGCIAAQDGKCSDFTQRTRRAQRPQSRRERIGKARVLQIQVARNKGFASHGYMNITFSLPKDLVKRVRKIDVDRNTTLAGLVREYLSELIRQDAATDRKRREREALERSFEQFQFRAGNKSWKPDDFRERS